MDDKVREDYQWLLETGAEPVLRKVRAQLESRASVLSINKTLRKTFAPSRVAIIIEQAQLQIRARSKFQRADEMFFTRRSLEQATSDRISQYKAARFANCHRVADICCGIGGDLVALANRSANQNATVGVDGDPLMASFANANAKRLAGFHAEAIHSQFEDFDTSPFDGLHFDPDRRSQTRTVKGDFFSPRLADIRDRLTPQQTVAIKVAPATSVSSDEDAQSHREWIGDVRECKQQVIWSGPMVAQPGHRTATVIPRSGEPISYTAGAEQIAAERPESAREISQWVYEPHATILAAELVPALATQLNLRPLGSSIDYLAGSDDETKHRLLRRYKVHLQLNLSLKQLARELRSRDIGKIVVKKRGIDLNVFQQIEALKLSGDRVATVIATRVAGKRVALITDIRSVETSAQPGIG